MYKRIIYIDYHGRETPSDWKRDRSKVIYETLPENPNLKKKEKEKEEEKRKKEDNKKNEKPFFSFLTEPTGTFLDELSFLQKTACIERGINKVKEKYRDSKVKYDRNYSIFEAPKHFLEGMGDYVNENF